MIERRVAFSMRSRKRTCLRPRPSPMTRSTYCSVVFSVLRSMNSSAGLRGRVEHEVGDGNVRRSRCNEQDGVRYVGRAKPFGDLRFELLACRFEASDLVVNRGVDKAGHDERNAYPGRREL